MFLRRDGDHRGAGVVAVVTPGVPSEVRDRIVHEEMKRPGKTRLVVDLEVEAQLTAKKGSRRTTAMVTGLYESGMVEVLANGRRFSLSEEWIRVPSGAHARLRKHARLAEASS